MFPALALLLAAAAPDLAPPAIEGVEVRQAIEHYALEGETARDLREQIRSRGRPNPETGRMDSGYTHSELAWNYDLAQSARGICEVRDVQVRLDVTITLPQWQPGRRTPAKLASQWRAYADALARHELRHRDYSIEAAVAIRDAIRGLPRMRCDAIRLRVDALTSQVMHRMRHDNRRYDEDTAHGRTECAYWIAD